MKRRMVPSDRKRRRRGIRCILPPLILCLAALGFPSCSDATGPGPEVSLSAENLILDRIGEDKSVEASVGDRTTTTPDLTVLSETRWIAEEPVLDPDSLERSLLVAHAPGQAVVSVKAFGGTPAEITVRVEPTSPVVVSFAPRSASADDTVEVRGYRLDAATTDRVDLGPWVRPVLSSDSATLRVIGPPATTSEECRGGARVVDVTIPGVRQAPGARLFRKRTNALHPALGSALPLDSATEDCLKLDPGRYALAYWDVRWIESERRSSEWFWDPHRRYTMNIVDHEAQAAAPTRASSRPELGPYAFSEPDETEAVKAVGSGNYECGSADEFWRRVEPLRVGESFELCGYDGDIGLPLHVFMVRDPLVFAYVEGDSAYADNLGPTLDSAGTFITHSELKHLTSAYGGARGLTFPATGQILIYVGRGGPLGATGHSFVRVGDRFYGLGYVQLNGEQVSTTVSKEVYLLVHELSHVYQNRYLGNHWNGVDQPGAHFHYWSSEGGADFLGYDAARRYLGFGLKDNLQWRAQGPAAGYTELAAEGWGGVQAGYASTASFFRDLVARAMDASGAPYDQVVGDVLTGSMEGWFGNRPNGTGDPGLAERMQRYLPGWKPTDAVLRWVLSQAMDDRTDSNTYQNAAFYRVWQDPLVRIGASTRTQAGFRSRATLTDHTGSVEFAGAPGSAGYVVIDTEDGVSLSLEGDSLAWAVGRFR